ncbi:Dihydrofolate reductase [Oopsacas minuta]|uniref:dihydrofolate reductase n=1 Tax=Oopsacas minuta TaxID=111878 RepID=A0AAV7KG04_9METZ|nr:Dihydrofolate reductase [Oopsacas minuta]
MACKLQEFPNILLNLIVIYDSKFGIAKNDKYPFPRFHTDFEFMCSISKQISDPTKRNVLIFGRKSWTADCSLIRRVWKSEYIIVLSRSINSIEGVDYVANSLEDAITHLLLPSASCETENIWVFGGSFIYKLALESDFNCKIFATEISHDFGCNVFFPFQSLPAIKEAYDDRLPTKDIVKEHGYEYTFHVYDKIA